MKLILTRHGETEENKKGILQGHLPGTLSKNGIEQGRKLSGRLKNEKIDVIFSSDLKRASDTAEIIAKHNPGIKIICTESLREGDGGDYTGKPTKELDWNNRPANAETVEQIQKRAEEILDAAYEKYPDKTVLFVAHAGFNRILIAQIMGLKDPFKDLDDQHNTAVNIFEIFEDKNHKVHCLNCIKHLKS